MTLYYAIVLFVFGTVLGSFYNVVGYRLPKGQSLIKPSSHCPNCNHKLKAYELIPIFSFLLLGRKCSNCKQKISWFYSSFEFITGVLFVLSYLKFGFSVEFFIGIILSSILVIVIISDYQTMTIPDEVLVAGLILFIPLLFIKNGFNGLLFNLLDGVICFGAMLLLKLFGDIVFKKESMGGGDIKLMFLFGLILGYQMGLMSVVLAAFIALPVSLIILLLKKDHEIPFGPFLSIACLIIYFTGLNMDTILHLFY